MVAGIPFVDFKRNNKVCLRNFTEPNDFHDIVKCLLVRMLRRNYPNQNNPIYTEHNPNEPNSDYPDIWMRIKQDIYIWEIQRIMSKTWEKRIMKQYEDMTLIVVPLNKLEHDWKRVLKETEGEADPLKSLKELLEPYVL